MSTNTSAFKEVLPKTGQLYQEDIPNLVLCKPKLLPLKSVTLEKLEQMQKDAQETVKQQEMEAQQEQQMMFGGGGSIGGSTGESQSQKLDKGRSLWKTENLDQEGGGVGCPPKSATRCGVK